MVAFSQKTVRVGVKATTGGKMLCLGCQVVALTSSLQGVEWEIPGKLGVFTQTEFLLHFGLGKNSKVWGRPYYGGALNRQITVRVCILLSEYYWVPLLVA